MIIEQAIAGFGTGFLVGITGVGGGAVMSPILIFFFGFSPAMAVGTDLMFNGVTKAVGWGVDGFRGKVSFGALRNLWMGSLPGILIGSFLVHYIFNGHIDLNAVIGTVILITATGIAVGAFWKAGLSDRAKFMMNWRFSITMITGLFVGLFVGMTSIGAGALGMIILLSLWGDLSNDTLVATDIAHAVPLCIIGAAIYGWEGTINYTALLLLLAGSIPGIVLGVKVRPHVNIKILKGLLFFLLFISGIKLIFS